MFCVKCGKEVKEEWAFCRSCGTKVEKDSEDNNEVTIEKPEDPEKVEDLKVIKESSTAEDVKNEIPHLEKESEKLNVKKQKGALSAEMQTEKPFVEEQREKVPEDKGEVIWSADFDQTQQPLLENILPNTRSTGSGFRWLTAAELTSAGLTRKLNSCPYLKRD